MNELIKQIHKQMKDALRTDGDPAAPLKKSWHFLQDAEEVVRAGVCLEFCSTR